MGPLQLQQFQIFQGAIPHRLDVEDAAGRQYLRTETTANGGPDRVFSVLTLVEGHALAGYAYLKWRGRDSLDVRDLHVTPSYRGRGLGSLLLSRIIAWGGTGGVREIWGGIVQKDMDETPFLLEWYRRHGFAVEAPESRNFLPVENIFSIRRQLSEPQT